MCHLYYYFVFPQMSYPGPALVTQNPMVLSQFIWTNHNRTARSQQSRLLPNQFDSTFIQALQVVFWRVPCNRCHVKPRRLPPGNNPPVRRQLRAKRIMAVWAGNTIGKEGKDASVSGVSGRCGWNLRLWYIAVRRLIGWSTTLLVQFRQPVPGHDVLSISCF